MKAKVGEKVKRVQVDLQVILQNSTSPNFVSSSDLLSNA